jgi:hypothetical protein
MVKGNFEIRRLIEIFENFIEKNPIKKPCKNYKQGFFGTIKLLNADREF